MSVISCDEADRFCSSASASHLVVYGESILGLIRRIANHSNLEVSSVPVRRLSLTRHEIPSDRTCGMREVADSIQPSNGLKSANEAQNAGVCCGKCEAAVKHRHQRGVIGEQGDQ
jgi:hypothetical protein